MIETIRQAWWSWTGLDPAEIIAINLFGNVIVRATDGAYWRICPEELSCRRVADNPNAFEALTSQDEFKVDWDMSNLVDLASKTLGHVAKGHSYCLKLPAVIGGTYEATNMGTIPLNALILSSGDLAEQIKDIPDGEHVSLEIVD